MPLSVATQVSHLPPVSTLFAALLGYNPVRNLLTPSGTLSKLPAHNVAVLTGKQFFPHLISAPFHHGLVIVFTAAAIMAIAGALVSLLRGKAFYYDDSQPVAVADGPSITVPAAPVEHDTTPDDPGRSTPDPDSASPAGGADEQAPRRGQVPARRDHAPHGGGA